MCASTVLQRARPPVRLHGSAVLLYYTVAPRSADVQDGSVYDVQEGSVFYDVHDGSGWASYYCIMFIYLC